MSYISTEAREAFTERFEDILTTNDRPSLIEGAEVPQYWQDDISELADELVPIYNNEVVSEWAEAGYPDVDDPGMIEGVTDVIKIMQTALYEVYSGQLYTLAYDAGFTD